jgi:hypothetical protein
MEYKQVNTNPNLSTIRACSKDSSLVKINTTDNLYILKSFGSDGKEIIKFGYSSVIENRLQS